MAGHDVEEFFGVVRRWGANESVKRLIDISIAVKHYGMRQYDKLLNKTKNTVMALKIMEQAAKDSGGQFTNKIESSVKNEVSYPSGLGHFYGRSSNAKSDT